MDTEDLKCIIKCDSVLSQSVIGVFAADEIPTHIPLFPFSCIVNTDPKNKPGQHWVAFYLPSKNLTGEFFDSYGNPPSYYEDIFQLFANGLSLKLKYSPQQLQSEKTNVCGYYCIYYLMNRCRGMNMYSIIKPFSDNHMNNDQFVYDYVTHTYSHCTQYSNNGQTCCCRIK